MLSLVVARVEPETDDVPNELLREHREFRLECFRERGVKQRRSASTSHLCAAL